MLKLGLRFLFGTFSQIIFVIVAYEFYFRYAQSNGGVYGNLISNVHPVIGIILLVELIISVKLISLSVKENNASKNINL